MALDDTLALPFFDDDHRRFAEALARWADATLPALPHDDVDAACRARVEGAGRGGLAQGRGAGRARRAAPAARRAHALHRARDSGVPRRARRFRLRHAGARHRLDLAVRLERAEAPLSAAGARRQGDRRLRAVGAGGGLRCRGAGDDRQARRRHMSGSTARRPGSRTAASPTITWCSRAPARRPARKGLSAFVVDADTPGLTVAERIEVIAPHPLARLTFDGVRVPVANRLGGPGEGFKVAMATLDIFRSTVGAAALGFARRALHETIEHASSAQAVRRAARRPADDAGRDRRQRDRGRCRGAAGLSRRLDQGSGRARASPARRRWPRCTRPRRRSA